MGLETASERLEESKKGIEWLVRHSDFSGGMGLHWAKEYLTDLRSQTGYWFGRLDTFSGMPHLPVKLQTDATFEAYTSSGTITFNNGAKTLVDNQSGFGSYDYSDGDTIIISGASESANNTTFTITGSPTSSTITVTASPTQETGGAGEVTIQLVVSASKTDYVAFAEFGDTGGSVYLYMVKGTEVWRTQGIAWRRVHTLASAQGRQFYARGGLLIWAAGPSASFQKTGNGTSWSNYTAYNAGGDTANARQVFLRHTIITPGVILDNTYRLEREKSGTWGGSKYVYPQGSVEPFIVRFTEQWLASEIDTEAWLASGPLIMRATTGGNTVQAGQYTPGLADITAGCAYQEEMALVDAGQGPYLWSVGRPLRDISIWREDGCPPNMKGKIKSITAIGDVLIVFWELDAGNSLIFWGRPNAAGQWCWHPRSTTLTGEFPLGSGNMGWAHGSLSTKDRRRLWTATADGSTFRLYYQDYPEASWNPLTWTTAQYEVGYLYLYTAWEDLLLMGDEAGALVEIERNAELGATSKLLTVDCRTDYDTVAEESASFPITLLTFTDTTRWQEIAPPDGIQALAVQQRIGLNRDSTVTNTPVLYDLGTTVRRQVRHVGLRRK